MEILYEPKNYLQIIFLRKKEYKGVGVGVLAFMEEGCQRRIGCGSSSHSR